MVDMPNFSVVFPCHLTRIVLRCFLELGLDMFSEGLDVCAEIFERMFRFIRFESLIYSRTNKASQVTLWITNFAYTFYFPMVTYPIPHTFLACNFSPLMHTHTSSFTILAITSLFSVLTYTTSFALLACMSFLSMLAY